MKKILVEEMEEEWMMEEETTVKRRASHIRSCCAQGCTSKGYRLLIEGERVQYFPFPLFDRDMCQRWAAAVKLPVDAQYEKSFVCSKHFRQSDYRARVNDDNKRSLRRSAIPSLDPVVSAGKTPQKKKNPKDESSYSEYSEEEEDDAEEDENKITEVATVDVSKDENLTALLFKDGDAEGGNEADEDFETPKVLSENKKVPLLLQNLLANGPPYPWRNQELNDWAGDRLAAHENTLQRARNEITNEVEKINLLQEQIDARKEMLALVIIKKAMGRMVLSQYLRTLD